MADNLKLTQGLDKVKRLLALIAIDPSQYCILSTTDRTETIVITSNHELKMLLLEDYEATEISDWTFHEQYQKSKGSKEYTIIGEGALIEKGY